MYHDVTLLCPMATKLDMVLDVVIPCGDLKCQRVLGSFELLLNSNSMVKERCLENYPCYTCAPLDPKLGIANYFPFPSVFKTLLHICQL